jgi:hypothetical protein
MGIAINFRGKIDRARDINKMIEELADISTSLKWRYDIIDDADQQVKGIVIKPHDKSESLDILVNKDMHLVSFIALYLKKVNEEDAKFVFVKTQFAPIDVHISLIKLLKYLKKIYISNLEVKDEGDYWDTMDEIILKEKMDFLGSRIDLVADIFEAHQEEIQSATTPENLVNKIEQILKKFGFNPD